MESLYKIADKEMRSYIAEYLQLADATLDLSQIREEHINTRRKKVILLAGKSVTNIDLSPKDAVVEWQKRAEVPFDLETAITTDIYTAIRTTGADYLDQIERQSNGFKDFSAKLIKENPHFLPILQHLSGVFSKDALKKIVGNSVSDNAISAKAAERIAELLRERVDPTLVNKGEILKRLESTLEGIVRDLVGKVFLESIVDSALKRRGIRFKREGKYDALSGVVCNIKADFVLPDEKNPLAFIEVRKSSSRHASLYSRDKMFSAINLKGIHKDLLGVLVYDGPWNAGTLGEMANIFDYIMPISKIVQLTETLAEYIAGDKTKLKWLVQFRIDPAQ